MQNVPCILIEGQIIKMVFVEIDLFKSYMIFMLNMFAEVRTYSLGQ